MTKAILFDVDGTLIDSNELHAAAWGETFLAFGIERSHDEIRAQIGKGGDNLIPALIPDIDEERQASIEAHRAELFARDYLPRVTVFPAVRALFEALFEEDIKIVLATSAQAPELHFHRSLIGCDDLIHAATSKDDVLHSKPCPDIFEAALGKVAPLGPDEVIVVGDSPWDMKAAGRAGMRGVALRCGGFADEALGPAGAISIWDDPAELAATFPHWLPGSVAA